MRSADAHEVGDLLPLRLAEVEARRAKPRVVELGPGVERDDAFERPHDVVVEERSGFRRLNHRGRIEGAVPEGAVSIVGSPEGAILRKGLGVAGGMRYVLGRCSRLIPMTLPRFRTRERGRAQAASARS